MTEVLLNLLEQVRKALEVAVQDDIVLLEELAESREHLNSEPCFLVCYLFASRLALQLLANERQTSRKKLNVIAFDEAVVKDCRLHEGIGQGEALEELYQLLCMLLAELALGFVLLQLGVVDAEEKEQEGLARITAVHLDEFLVGLDGLRQLLADVLDILEVSSDIVLEHVEYLLTLRLDVDRFEFIHRLVALLYIEELVHLDYRKS